MAKWYEKPYPGGPMVAVKGFPRPLYPPDAASKGKKPSVAGPDVEAYKRIVSRCGRWAWTQYDQTYSNGFAHGKSGNVGETGVAGVQRQQKISDTGWIGPDTFNLLRSIRIPLGLPNAGNPAMDAYSVDLINAAWKRFGGKEPIPKPPPPPITAAIARLKNAQSQIGTTESPFGSNRTKYGVWYGFNGVPWCAIFATWADCTSEAPSQVFRKGSRWSYVPDIVYYAQRGMNGLYITSSPRPGDIVCFDWGGDGVFDHVGIVEKGLNSSGGFVTVEGNTSGANWSNGGQVARCTRNKFYYRCVFVRVKE
jgi:hypothetical protein